MRIFVLAIIAFVTLQQVNCAALSKGRQLRGGNFGAPVPPWLSRPVEGSSGSAPIGRVLRGSSTAEKQIPTWLSNQGGRVLASAHQNPVSKVVSMLTKEQKEKARKFARDTVSGVQAHVNNVVQQGLNVLDQLLKIEGPKKL